MLKNGKVTIPLPDWDPAVYVTRRGIEEMAGVTCDTVRSWQQKGFLVAAETDYHDPNGTGCARLYLRAKIEEFLAVRRPSGRPRTSDLRANELRFCIDEIARHKKNPERAVQSISQRLAKHEKDAAMARERNSRRVR